MFTGIAISLLRGVLPTPSWNFLLGCMVLDLDSFKVLHCEIGRLDKSLRYSVDVSFRLHLIRLLSFVYHHCVIEISL